MRVILFLLFSISAIGQTIPKKLTTFEGITIRLNKPIVVIDLFVTTCPHCQRHASTLADLAKTLHRKIMIVGLAADGNESERLRNYRRDYGAVYPLGALTNDLLLNLAPVDRRVPQMIVFKNGKYWKTIIGWAMEQEKELKESLQ